MNTHYTYTQISQCSVHINIQARYLLPTKGLYSSCSAVSLDPNADHAVASATLLIECSSS